MTWRFWAVGEPAPKNPRLTFEVLPCGHVKVAADLPEGGGDGEALARAVLSICDGELLPAIEQAVLDAGGGHVLSAIDDTLEGTADQPPAGPAVPPSEVFS